MLTVVVACMFCEAFSQEAGVEAQWERANTLYINGDYAGASDAYEAIAGQGYVSSRLFYNMGNAYFKAGKLGKAVLNYNKAQRLAPYDRDIEYNLEVANGHVKDRIDPIPEFFLTRWIKEWRAALDSNGWAVVSLLLLALTFAGALVFLLAQKRAWRKTGFFSGMVFFVLFLFAAVFAGVEKREFRDASQGVVTARSVAVKSAPERDGSDLFIIHEGTKVNILSSYGPWTEIMIADGNKGWLGSETIEAITY